MMRRHVRVAALAAAALAIVGVRGARAQQSATIEDSTAWIVRVAGATGAQACPCHSPSLNVPHDRQLYIVGVGLRNILHASTSGFEVAYDLQVLPLIVSRGTADENLRVALCRGNQYCATTETPSPWTTRATGIGILPLGFTALAPIAPRLRFQLRGAAGGVRLSKPVPVLEGHKFNFLAEASTTLELRVTSSYSLTGGLVFNHISNGGTAAINPGMNSRMIEFGIVRH
ncbi:MAG TPA: acyloxyacyl hydrolase [Gemmatimonadaceae bacterium]|nr:acyloxyacyl hydrolase [Gemmatimonadaceae bacterium]